MVGFLFKNKKGFTLIEILIVLAMIGLLVPAIFSLFSVGNNTFVRGDQQYNVQSDVRLAVDAIIKQVRNATELAIMPVDACESEKDSQTYNYIYIKEGTIHHSIYDTAHSTRIEKIIPGDVSSVDSAFSKANSDTLGIKIGAVDGNQQYIIDTQVKLLNFELAQPATSIQGDHSDLAIRYSKEFVEREIPGSDPETPEIQQLPPPILTVEGKSGEDKSTVTVIGTPGATILFYKNKKIWATATLPSSGKLQSDTIIKSNQLDYVILRMDGWLDSDPVYPIYK